LFAWMRPWLARLAERETLAGLSDSINKNAMQIYLWHVPVIVLIAVVLVLAGASFPEPLSGEWWQSRPPFLIAVALLLIPIVIGVAWLERRGEGAVPAPVGPWLATLKVVLGIAGVVTILVAGFTPAYGAAVGVTLLLVAVLLRSPRRRGAVEPATTDAPADDAAAQSAASSSARSSAATPPQNS
ncbi:MAG: hypothetical protein Q7J04_05735, partial [Microcella sp.]|nr:hypothetical protein [Microcella sp.]